MSLRLMIAVAGSSLLSGCAALSNPADLPQKTTADGTIMITVPEGARETYFSDPADKYRHCRAPSPDVSITSSGGISLAGGTAQASGSGGADYEESALSLGGRGPEVLIARELMYRACEMTTNLDTDEKTTIEVYERFLQSIESIAKNSSVAGAGTSGQSLVSPNTVITPPAAPAISTPP